jgi:anaphase-promoting complex subunit 4
VEIAAWNPGKDLLAMVTKDHQLVVHRLNWQRLWAVTPGNVSGTIPFIIWFVIQLKKIVSSSRAIRLKELLIVIFATDLTMTAICWRPDGKALAVGHTNGSIAIHDVEVRFLESTVFTLNQ